MFSQHFWTQKQFDNHLLDPSEAIQRSYTQLLMWKFTNKSKSSQPSVADSYPTLQHGMVSTNIPNIIVYRSTNQNYSPIIAVVPCCNGKPKLAINAKKNHCGATGDIELEFAAKTIFSISKTKPENKTHNYALKAC